MGTLTLADYRVEVRLSLGNLPTSHPLYTQSLVDRAINQAPNRLIRMAFGGNGQLVHLFPEKHNSWTIGPTVVGRNRIALDSDILVPLDVRSSESSTSPTWADTQERVVSGPKTPQLIGLLNKDATAVTGYAKLWTRKANDIMYHPTTRTGFVDYFRVYGIAREAPITSAGATFTLSEDWDDHIVLLAAERVARKMSWTDRANELLSEVRDQVNETLRVNAIGAGVGYAEVADGMPSRGLIYGA